MHTNPFAELEFLRRGIDELFEGFWPAGWGHRSVFLPGRSARGYPLMNIADEDDALVVEAFAPGIDADTLEVTAQRNVLTLTGEKKPLADIKREAYHRNERATGKFTRTFQLNFEIDQDRVSAEYKDGILSITLPKAKSALPKSVKIQVK